MGHALGDENHVVVIENQFGRTDHDHLGKLLTYASAHEATTCIWIAEKVSDDHRGVIDWLNENTPARLCFYLARLLAYRIGESPAAPQLDVVSRPNVQVKLERTSESPDLKQRHIWRREFWQEILEYIKERKPPFRVQAPSTASWSAIAIGRSDLNLELSLTRARRCIGCALYIGAPWKEAAFQQLSAQREAIEADIGERLEWRNPPDKRSAKIELQASIDPADPANRERVKEWMHRQAVAFYQAFQPRVRALRPPIPDGEERE